MRRTLTIFLLSFFSITSCFASDYENAWLAISKKDFKTAKSLLIKATKDPANAWDAYLTLLDINTYQGDEAKMDGFVESFSNNPNKNAYLYSLWFNEALLGDYGKKQTSQLNLLDKIIKDPSYNGSIKAAAHYSKAMHFIFSNDFGKSRSEFDEVGAVTQWQLTGPFENISGSGFKTINGPIEHTAANVPFKAMNNIDVTWFTPGALNREGWTFTYPHINTNTAIVYAQTFVNANEDMKVLLNSGCNGSLKVWVNDGLVISEPVERTTELDYYKNYCTLKKGYNRILVQLGYTDQSNPNFIIRLTNDNGVAVKGLSENPQPQVYPKMVNEKIPGSQKHFAETYFESRIATQPSNILNYILLSQTYLRNNKTTESRQVIEKALSLAPNNPLLKFELIQCLIKSDNRTLLMQEIEWLKENDPDSYFNLQLKLETLIAEEKYSDADEMITKMKSLFGNDEYLTRQEINVLAYLQKVDELFALINKSYEIYPENPEFAMLSFNIKKMALKDVKGAILTLEKFLKSNYNHNIFTTLVNEYDEQGMKDKYVDAWKRIYAHFSYDPTFANTISSFYFNQQNYSKAFEYADQSLKLAPFSGQNWYNLGIIQEQMKQTNEAINSFKKTIYYNRTNYDAHKKLIALQKKTDPSKLIPEIDAYSLIKNSSMENGYNYSYVFDSKNIIIYDEGASEEFIQYAIRIHNQRGIDDWKEIYLGYDENNQNLLIEKCEAVKLNGSKLPAERNGNEIVFTGLEPGDAIHVKYRIQNFYRGRIGKEFFDKFTFNAFVPTELAKYAMIIPKGYRFKGEMINSNLKPTVQSVTDYDIHTWEMQQVPAMKSEPLMPRITDIGSILHISTLKTWNKVADWYSDLAYQDVSNNFELNTTFEEIFAKEKPADEFQKAKMIYEYIIKNIRYSSVSFRQSGLGPQNVSKTLSTRLGDCKDLSTLFVSLAANAGIQSQLVLIDTRDNGIMDMVLPSMEFNHCIVLAKLNGKDYYIELTDNNLPFTSLPNNLNGALSLLIPPHGQKSKGTLKPVIATNRSKDRIVRNIDIKLNGKDETLTVDLKLYGQLTTSTRDYYTTLDKEIQMQDFEKSISNNYKNPVKLESLTFEGLNTLSDSVSTKYVYSVKNEIIEAGSMKMIKIPFIDVIATLDNFNADKREFPVEYWSYENVDNYETIVTFKLPAGQQFVEVPGDTELSNKGNMYSLKYIKEGESLKVVRKAILVRENVSTTDYADFKKFMNDIVEAESKYIVFK